MIKYRINPEAAKAARARLNMPMVQVVGPAPVRKASPLARKALRIVERAERCVVGLGIAAVLAMGLLSAFASPTGVHTYVTPSFLSTSQG